jgi:hypothetical protein
MKGERRMTIEADSSADLLCRLLGLFAQRDLAAPGMAVAIDGRQMTSPTSSSTNAAALPKRCAWRRWRGVWG